jgi:uncharacterized membrane protein YraQ (UPF0718 family)
MNALPLEFAQTIWAILAESAGWILVSLVAGGLIHEFLPTSGFQRLLRRGGIRATSGAVLLGGMLPICSCGVIPLAISFYRSGVPLAPVMAFTAATPIINPAAVILSLALLGVEITAAYVLLGLSLPFLLGLLAARFGDRERAEIGTTESAIDAEPGCCASGIAEVAPWPQRAHAGLRWGLLELGPSIGFYLLIGLLLAGALTVLIPADWAERFLSSNSFIGLLAAGVLGASIYVCAVAHIPVVATLLAAGAGPGAAIVFLVTGTATNLPELYTLYRTIGRRTIAVYVTTLVVASMFAGGMVNVWLAPGFTPVFDPLTSLNLIERADKLWVSWPTVFNSSAALVVLSLAVYGSWLRVRIRLLRWFGARHDDGCCATSGEPQKPRL